MLKELSTQEMNEIKGGNVVSQEEYCATLWVLIQSCWNEWSANTQESAINALNAHCPN